ncbi:MAG: ABC transporter ATP-binding protein [Pseudomonadota bacterium]
MSRSPDPRLAIDAISRRFDAVTAVDQVSLAVEAGEIACMLGPSGCGKTTTLRIAAGVERQDKGRVLIDGHVISDDRTHQPPEHRQIGLMFQDFALFPHLSVVENVAFGLPKTADRRIIATGYLDRVGLAGFGDKYPHMLSGGEQQRVALARALAPRPRIMLMDEPFSGLDNRLRDEVRDDTLSILREEGTAVLLVTHDPAEAMRMSDWIALMRRGTVVQTGAPHELYHRPLDRETAAFFSDLNVLTGRVAAGRVATPFGDVPTPDLQDGAPAEVVIRPQHVSVMDSPAPSQPATRVTVIPAIVVRARFLGAHTLIEARLTNTDQMIRAMVPQAYLPSPGETLNLAVSPADCLVFAADRAPKSYRAAAE